MQVICLEKIYITSSYTLQKIANSNGMLEEEITDETLIVQQGKIRKNGKTE